MDEKKALAIDINSWLQRTGIIPDVLQLALVALTDNALKAEAETFLASFSEFHAAASLRSREVNEEKSEPLEADLRHIKEQCNVFCKLAWRIKVNMPEGTNRGHLVTAREGLKRSLDLAA